MADFDALNAIHKKVYHNFTYELDSAQYHVDEKWVVPDENYDGTSKIKGDCEDFALACRKLCRDAGLQTRLVVCDTTGGLHCVLECEGWIFDCNQHEIVPRQRLPYKWLYISGYEPGSQWHRIAKD